jgi:hypothetical protein
VSPSDAKAFEVAIFLLAFAISAMASVGIPDEAFAWLAITEQASANSESFDLLLNMNVYNPSLVELDRISVDLLECGPDEAVESWGFHGAETTKTHFLDSKI